jgi:hypothetical protein
MCVCVLIFIWNMIYELGVMIGYILGVTSYIYGVMGYEIVWNLLIKSLCVCVCVCLILLFLNIFILVNH